MSQGRLRSGQSSSLADEEEVVEEVSEEEEESYSYEDDFESMTASPASEAFLHYKSSATMVS
jgi:hypothetical protein